MTTPFGLFITAICVVVFNLSGLAWALFCPKPAKWGKTPKRDARHEHEMVEPVNKPASFVNTTALFRVGGTIR